MSHIGTLFVNYNNLIIMKHFFDVDSVRIGDAGDIGEGALPGAFRMSIKDLIVVSYNEIDSNVELSSVGMVTG